MLLSRLLYGITVGLLLTQTTDAQQDQVNKSIPSTEVWKLMPGYPRASSKFTPECNRNLNVDIKGGSVTFKGMSLRLNKEVSQKISFTVPLSVYHFDGTAKFTVDATGTDHEVANEVNLGVGLASWYASSATSDDGSNWQRIISIGAEKSAYNEQVGYKPVAAMKMNAPAKYIILALTVITFDKGVWGGCETILWKYEKGVSVSPVFNPVNNVTDTCKTLTDLRRCNKTYVAEGPGTDGKMKKVQLVAQKIFYDFCGINKTMKIFNDLSIYQGYPYTRIGDPSYRWDCAGWTADKIWNTGPVVFGGDDFYREIIRNFGTQISSNFSFGDVREGDIVAYHRSGTGEVGHITLVRKVERNELGIITRIQIETKDTDQSVFLHDLPLRTSHLTNSVGLGDPLVRTFGIPHVYRIPRNVTMKELKPGDCD